MKQTGSTDRRQLWTKDYFVVICYSLLIYIAHFMLVATLPLYVKEIGGNNFTAGLVMGIYSLSALVLRPFFGRVLDRQGRKPVLLIGSLLFLSGTYLQSIFPSVGMILVLRIIQGVGFGANTTAFGTMIADLTPPDRLAEGIGYFGITNPLGTAVGPIVGLALVGCYGYRALFTVSALIIGIALVMSWLINYEARRAKSQDSGAGAGAQCEEAGPLLERGALPASKIMFCMALAQGSILTFLPTYAMQRGIGDVGNFFLVYAGAIIVTRLAAGKVTDRIGPAAALTPGLILAILGLIILANAGTMGWFEVVAVLYGFGYGIVQPLLNAVAVRMAPDSRRGAANAVFSSALDIGIGLGSILWGTVAQHAGFTAVYLAAAGCVGLALFAALAFFKRK